MGWRDWMRNFVVGSHGVHPSVKEDDLAAAVLAMPPADRIALARELLAGTGRVVARVPDAGNRYEPEMWWDGWFACRAAMMGEE